jgi:hypothetical protein
MKLFHFLNNRSAKVARQPLIQPLEPRRLMSLTAGPDIAPDAPAPAPIVHSFGFENLLPPPPGAGSPFAPSPILAGTLPETTATIPATDTQEAAASNTTATDTAVPTPPAAADNSLSALYATLNHSTVASIDNASDIQPANIATAVPAMTNAAPLPATSNAPVEIVTNQKPESVSTPTDGVNETVPSPLALPSSELAASTSAESVKEIIPQTSFAHALETELQNVSTLAREMVSQMGRDLAIELAHIESTADSAVIGQLKAWDCWGIAAVAGATVIAAAYLQSESRSDEAKTRSVFSSQLIETSGV